MISYILLYKKISDLQNLQLDELAATYINMRTDAKKERKKMEKEKEPTTLLSPVMLDSSIAREWAVITIPSAGT